MALLSYGKLFDAIEDEIHGLSALDDKRLERDPDQIESGEVHRQSWTLAGLSVTRISAADRPWSLGYSSVLLPLLSKLSPFLKRSLADSVQAVKAGLLTEV